MSSRISPIDKWYTWVFVIILTGFLLLFLFTPKQSFSMLENRHLQAFPTFTWSNIWDGTFTKEAETYVTDHFPYRDQWVASKSLLEQLRMQQENNGVFRGKDEYLLENLTTPDYDKLAQYIAAINQFAQKHTDRNITLLLAPTSVGLYPEKLPWLAESHSQLLLHQFINEQLTKQLTWIDGFTFLEPAKNSDKPLYYKTDHHWTTYGAYLAYVAYAEQLGWQPKQETDFIQTMVSNNFLGSYHTRSLFSGTKPDSITVYTPITPLQSTLYVADTDTTYTSLYDESYLTKKDQYAYFQGGVHALMKITTELTAEEVELNKLVVIKDSYAHSMLPFLTAHVKELHVIDVRFYNGNISRYMEEQQIDDALLLFNTSTFISENSLLKLK